MSFGDILTKRKQYVFRGNTTITPGCGLPLTINGSFISFNPAAPEHEDLVSFGIIRLARLED